MPPRQFPLKQGSFKHKVDLVFSESSSSYSSLSDDNNNIRLIPKTNSAEIDDIDDEKSNENDCFHINSESGNTSSQHEDIIDNSTDITHLDDELSSNKNKQTESFDKSNQFNQNQPKQHKIQIKSSTEQNSSLQNNNNSTIVLTKNEPQNDQQQESNDCKQTYQIMYKQKNFQKNSKRCLQMTQNGILVYTCKPAKSKKYGKVHIICTKDPINVDSPHFIGIIVRHQKGQRFTLYGKINQSEDQNPQLAGISFIKIKDDAVVRHFRVAIPSEGVTYIPSSKEDDLSRIAFRGDNVENIKIYSSAIPIKHPDGTLALNLGPYSIKSSRNNFIIRDEETNSSLFTSFKTCDGICTIILRPPFLPLIGMAIAIAILTS